MALNFPSCHLRTVLAEVMPSKLPLLDLPIEEKLNLGSGDESHGIDKGFVNVDRSYSKEFIKARQIDAVLIQGDVMDVGSRFAIGSISVIYAHHMLEHIDCKLVPVALDLWASLLRPGGIMYIGVPDSLKCIELMERNPELWEEINGFILQNGEHKAILWESMLVRLMRNAELTVKVWKRDRSEDSHLAQTETIVVGVR